VTKNLGDVDRTVRLLIGAPLTVLFFRNRAGSGGLALGVVSAWLLATSILGWCLFYALFRVSTCKPEDATAAKR
jgi:Protein of unknown function (DUF2892)